MFHSHVHVYIVCLHLILGQVLSQRSSQDYTLSSGSPSLLPIAVLSWSDFDALCQLVYSEFLLILFGISAILAGVTSSAVGGVCHLPSLGSYRRGNLVPIHIFLLIVHLLWVLLLL